jgi:hypothetical protein
MISQNGVRHFYNLHTGKGESAVDFGWTCLALDIIGAERGA